LADAHNDRDELMKQVEKVTAKERATKLDLEGKVEANRTEKEEMLCQKNVEVEKLRDEVKQSTWSLARESQQLEQALTVVESLKASNENLTKEIGEIKEKVKLLKPEADLVPELKAKLLEASTTWSSFEDKALVNFERKISLIKMEKDIEIDTLRQDLMNEKEGRSALESNSNFKISELETSNKNLEAELESKVQRKNAKILALEQKLSAQNQVVGHMRQEMDQLQSSMEKATMIRRAEIEEIEQEVMDGSARSTQQDREIAKLKMVLEDRKLRYKDELNRLKCEIESLKEDSPLVRGMQTEIQDRRIEDLHDTIQKLKWRNNSLTEDCTRYKEKLQKFDRETRAFSKHDKWRNSALKEEVRVLNGKIKEMDDSIVPESVSTARVPASSISPKNISEFPSRDDVSTTTKFTF